MAKADFNYMYSVTVNSGNFELGSEVQGIGLGGPVTVTDTKDTSIPGEHDNKKFLGDVPNDQFKVSHAGTTLTVATISLYQSRQSTMGVTQTAQDLSPKKKENYYFFTDTTG